MALGMDSETYAKLRADIRADLREEIMAEVRQQLIPMVRALVQEVMDSVKSTGNEGENSLNMDINSSDLVN
ncbi:hypothetical protein Tcan_04224 [Toxocara canis]|uniref:Uncharacterized protein n=1 Tax=Toxocara canis TaxID=6265 RepID=A0A0B2UPZ6_TOXCA|nr:hypothetical protein Tcan_04224 [Toxocara canis]